MAFTKITGPGIHTLSNIMTHNVKSSGIITAVNGNLTGWLAVGSTASFGGDVSIGGTLTYDDVTNVEAVGIITAKAGIHVGAAGTIIHALSEDNGKVGIGTDNPSHKLDISDDGVAFPSASGSTLLRLRDSAGTATLSIDAAAGSFSAIQFGDSAAASMGSILYNHVDDSMKFNTGGTGTKLFIASDGKVGIGTTNPDTLLHLHSSSPVLQIEDITATQNQLTRLLQVGAGFRVQLRNNTNDGTLTVQGYGNATTTDFIRVASDGKVGINSSSPTAKLDVIGDTKLQGNLDVAGVSTFSDDVTLTTASGNNIVFDKSDNALKFGNDVELRFGLFQQFRIKQNATTGNSEIRHNRPQTLVLHSDLLDLRPHSNNSHVYLRTRYNSSIDLYYANSVKFATSGIGATVFGELDVTGPADIEGNLTVGVGGTTITTVVGAAASVGIGDASPSYMLDVAGAINSQTDVKVNGVSVTEQALNDAVAMAIALG